MHQFNSAKPLAYRCSVHKRRSVGSHRMSMAPTEVTCFNPHALFCSFRANATSIRKSVAIDFWNLMPCAIAGAFTRPTPKNNDLFQRLCLWQSYCRVMPLQRSVFFFFPDPSVFSTVLLHQVGLYKCSTAIAHYGSQTSKCVFRKYVLKPERQKLDSRLPKLPSGSLTPQAPFLDMFAEHILATRT